MTLHMNVTKLSIPKSNWLHSLLLKMEKLYTVSKNKICGSDHQLLIAKFRLKLKKTRKNTMPARHDLNKISFEFAVEVINRFKGLDLVNSMPEELWTEIHNIVLSLSSITSVVPDSVRPHRRQPTRLPRPWDSPGKNTGVGCHFLLQ